MTLETPIDMLRFRLMLKREFVRKATAGAALVLLFAVGIPNITRAQDQYPPVAGGEYQTPPSPAGQYQAPPPPDGQYQAPPPPDGQYQAPPPSEGQYQFPPPQAQYAYPPPQGQYYPPPAYAQPYVPAPPPGAMWVGEPGECLYANGVVYWCAPGVVFTGFPVGWDFARYPVVRIEPGIVLDPIWFGGWRREHPGFVFRGRIATDFERRAFFQRREEFRNRARRDENHERGERQRERRPEERR